MWSLRNCRPTLCLPAIIAAMLAACGGGGGSDAVPTAGAPGRQERRRVHADPGAQRQRGLARDHAHDLAVAERARGRRPSRRQQVHRADGRTARPSPTKAASAGYAATQPAKGKKIDPDSPDVSRYVGYLTSKHDNALAGVGGGGKKAYSYSYTFNGFAADAHRSTGRAARHPGRRARRRQGRDAPARHLDHPDVSRPERPLAASGTTKAKGRERHHRHRRLAASGPSTRASPTAPAATAAARRTASSTTSRSRAGTASARPASSSMPATATRS